MKLLKKTEFGNPILRRVAKQLSDAEIKSKSTKELISNMYATLENKKYGVGLAAPQIGESLAIIVIDTKPTPTRPDLVRQKLTLINPEIIKTYGVKTGMWEACISGSKLYGKAMRHRKVKLSWKDETAEIHEKDFDGFTANVIQHEVDHLNGILFVDRVEDTTTFMTYAEYKKMRSKNATMKV